MKILMLSVLTLFIVYSIVSLLVKIPNLFNNIFYIIVSIFAVYFIVFYSDIGKGMKERFKKNIDNLEAEKSENKN